MLDEYKEAAQCFEQSIALGRDDDQIREMLEFCAVNIDRKGAKERKFLERVEKRILPDPNIQPFLDFDLSNFWDDDEYSLKEYVSPLPTEELIQQLEQELGYKLPYSYIWLMQQHNGGIPFKTCHKSQATTWAYDHVAITGIMGIGREKANSIGGSFGSRFWIEEWGYPDIGVAICDCPSAGHDMIFLDYRHCGKDGEPMVVHIDQENDYEITWLADDFESFIRGLQFDEHFEDSDD